MFYSTAEKRKKNKPDLKTKYVGFFDCLGDLVDSCEYKRFALPAAAVVVVVIATKSFTGSIFCIEFKSSTLVLKFKSTLLIVSVKRKTL